MRVVIDDKSSIMSHMKFLLIPMNPPILDIRDFASVLSFDWVIFTTGCTISPNIPALNGL